MSESKKPPSPRQVLLGLFILGQIAFLFVSNFTGFIKYYPTLKNKESNKLINRVAPLFADEKGHGWHWLTALERNSDLWQHLSGQDQAWSLFAPSVSKETGFTAVLLSWQEPDPEDLGFPGTMLSFDQSNGNVCAEWNHPASARQPSLKLASQIGVLAAQYPWEALSLSAANQARIDEKTPRMDLLLSANEPIDLSWYVRCTNCRIRKYESNFYFNPSPWPDELPDQLGTRLYERMGKISWDYHDITLAYLKYRVREWQHQHTDAAPPKQVIMLFRYFRINGPDEARGWEGPYVVPVLRWLPERPAAKGARVLETYDFNQQRFR